MDNETVFSNEELIAVSEPSGIATVTAVITTVDNWTQNWATDDSIVQFFNENSTTDSSSSSISTTAILLPTTNSTLQNFVNAVSVWNIFEEIPWLLWVVIGAGVSLTIVIIATIITCFSWNKKRKSRRGSASDQRIVGSTDSISQFMWPRWMLCCPKSVFERQDDLRRMRQNSASNLDPYRRPPLPPINPKDIYEDGFQGNFLPPRRLEPVKTTESHLNALTEKAENTSMLEDNRDRDEGDLFGINITGIRGVPVISVENHRRRPLPVPPSDCFNHL